MPNRLTTLNEVGGLAARPNYVPEAHGIGLVHIGVGAFHRAHQAAMTDDALAQHGGDWRIAGVSLRSSAVATELNRQNGLYTVLERGQHGTNARVIAAIDHVIAADTDATLARLCNPAVRVVTLTVTEAGYGIDREHRLPDTTNPVVLADLAQPSRPVGVLGLLVAALAQRRASGIEPFTVLSCDNLPANGALVRDGVVGFARQAYADEVAAWIHKHVSFPCSMVDRITPAATQETYSDAIRLTHCVDRAAVETEPFSQWIIEDHFPTGRPAWEAGGARFVDDVAPYEQMKLTMLNGAHSMLAYSGFLSNKLLVKDVMNDEHLSLLVQRHFEAAAAVLAPLASVDYAEYAAALTQRFINPAIAHQTFQIASDGTQKLPQRLFQPALQAIHEGKEPRAFAFATAMWMRFCLQQCDDGARYELRDPRADEISQFINDIGRDASKLCDAFYGMREFIPQELRLNSDWRTCVDELLTRILNDGCVAAIRHEASLSVETPFADAASPEAVPSEVSASDQRKRRLGS